MEEEIMEELLDEDTQKGKYMTFMSCNEYYGIDIKYINEIIGIQKITKIPKVDDFIKGLVNLRGKIIPVVDVRSRFEQESAEYNDRTCIVIINVKSMLVGLIVERIADVVNIADEDILPPPSVTLEHGNRNKFVYGLGKVGDSVKLLLDPVRLINYEELNLTEF